MKRRFCASQGGAVGTSHRPKVQNKHKHTNTQPHALSLFLKSFPEASLQALVRRLSLGFPHGAFSSSVTRGALRHGLQPGADLRRRPAPGGGAGVRGTQKSVPRGHVWLNSPPSDSDRCEIQPDKTDLPPAWDRGPGTMGGAHPVPPVTVDI